MRLVLLETTRDESARGILPCEEIVVSTRSVHKRVRGDIEHGAIDGEVDREGRVGPVVEGELLGREAQRSLLFVDSLANLTHLTNKSFQQLIRM